jgi:hypothetical protein
MTDPAPLQLDAQVVINVLRDELMARTMEVVLLKAQLQVGATATPTHEGTPGYG